LAASISNLKTFVSNLETFVSNLETFVSNTQTNVFTAKMTMAKARGMTLMEQPEAAEAVSTRKTVVSARNHRGNAVLLRRIFRAKRRRVGADRRRSADSCCSGAAREAYETAGGCGHA
jgi:hypothetical protein